MNNATLYNGRAKDYTKGRPGYCPKLIDCIYDDFAIGKLSVIADIGSGTGKFSKLLLERGNEVFCVEPNADMRKIAEQELNSYSNFHSICGDAEHTTLQENCIDCIVSAQAFHWFDVEKFRQECLRIIKRDRKVFLIWNVEDSNDCTNQELVMIFQQYCPDIKKSKGKTKLDDKIRFFFGGRYEYLSFDYPLFLDKEKFISKCLSSSYALTRGDKYYYEFIHALYSLFDKYETNGTIAIRNKTIAFCGSLT